MYPLYKDIREGLGTPLWIDKHGVPRYSPFHPQDAAEIYNDWVALMSVQCQACGKVFLCANSESYIQLIIKKPFGRFPLSDTAAEMIPFLVGWGDAPWHDSNGHEARFDSQCAGTTMTTEWTSLRVFVKVRGSENNEFGEWEEISEPECYLPNYRRLDEEEPE